MSNKTRVVIGFITYGKSTAQYLPYFLSSLEKQTFKDYRIIVADNSEKEENENSATLRNHPEINVSWSGSNLGYAKAYNKLIKQAFDFDAEYFLALNPDMELEPSAIGKMVLAMDSEEKLGSVSPRIMKWDFANLSHTKTIDTCGIQLLPGLRFVDIMQNETVDLHENLQILGPSGAAALYRLSALKKAEIDHQYFDELMFMYKEDCDLAYRLKLLGYESKCIKDAVVYHDRTATAEGKSNLDVAVNRRNKSQQVKRWSFLNQQIIFRKYWRLQNFGNKLSIIWYEFKMLIFILFFERYLLAEFKKFWLIRKLIKQY